MINQGAEMSKLIERLTEDIIRAFEIEVPIKDIDFVVKKLGGKLKTSESYSTTCLCKQGDGFIIVIPNYGSEERKRFMVSREIGHLFLHMGYLINEELWKVQQSGSVYVNNSSAEAEYHATEFAEALLMPRSQYKEVLRQNTCNNLVSTSKIAEVFRVSITAASNRGKMLGYLQEQP